MTGDTLTFGDLLRRHRVCAGLSQEALAERAGLSMRGVSDLERGLRRTPYRDTVLRLAEALGLRGAERQEFMASSRGLRTSARMASADQERVGLPAYLSSFVGRTREIAEVRRLLEGTRLLTLTGPGGVGKTRLAVRVAETALAEYAEGVWVVELAPLADPALVLQAVATAVGVREQSGRSLQQTLVDALRPQRRLLVLDNCEHLVSACAELAEMLLRACPDLRILATSREVLRIAGETAWRVPSLGLPPLVSAGPSAATGLQVSQFLEQVEQSEAVRLFVARAAAALPGFVLTDENAATVARICHQLDGLPLAIELAAARVSALGLEQLAARLADRFRLLTDGSRTALPRHQTLRATLEWSYALLTQPEQRLFERLAVFAGGWTLEAAEAVGAGYGIESEAVFGLLARLVDKSLVVVQEGPGGEARYRLLETLREYGRECLANSGHAMATQRRHATFFLALAERAEPELTGAEQEVWLGRLEQEHENLRATLQWTMECEEAELGLRLAGALGRFWWVHGHQTEGRRWLEGLLAAAGRGGAALAPTRAKSLSAAGALARDQGDYSRAAALLDESLGLFRKLGDKAGSASALNDLGSIATYWGDNSRAVVLLEESLGLFREMGDKAGAASALNNLGRAATFQGDFSRAAAVLEESLALCRELGDKGRTAWALFRLAHVTYFAWEQSAYGRASALVEESLGLLRELEDKAGLACSLGHLGRIVRDQGAHGGAIALFEESLGLFRDLGDRGGIAYALHALGRAAIEKGDYGRATALMEESLGLFQDLGDRRGTAVVVEGLAAVACAQEQGERAVRLFGAAEALREAISAPRPATDPQARYDRCIAAARARLGDSAFAAAWAAGRAMALEQAVDEAPGGCQRSEQRLLGAEPRSAAMDHAARRASSFTTHD